MSLLLARHASPSAVRHALLVNSVFGSARGLATPSKMCSSSPSKPCSMTCSKKQSVAAPHPADLMPRQADAALGGVLSPLTSKPYHDWVLMHPVYTAAEVNAVKIVRHTRTTITDKVASALVAFARWGFDVVTRYKHSSPEAALAAIKKSGKSSLSLEELKAQGFIMSEAQWLSRILLLESIAGVPGMVAATVRHLRSLRLMKRDGGWIHTLLEEAENERMHLLTFMKIRSPTPAFRLVVLAVQGIFYNLFFMSYLISPRAAHRFVGYLEEEACVTYTQIIDEMKRGHLPEWEAGAQAVPQIAKDYWRLPADSTMLDLILAVRADEATHRFLNHTLANLEGASDMNPFGLKQASAEVQGNVPGFTREQSLEWAEKVKQDMLARKDEPLK